MAVRNAVVTGANRGIGLEMCKQLSRQVLQVQDSSSSPSSSYMYNTIYALCRNTSEGLTDLSKSTDNRVQIVDGIDVTKEETYRRIQSILKTEESDPLPIHLLVHNAGAYGTAGDFPASVTSYQTQTLENINLETMNTAFRLNALAPLFLTKALLPNLRAAASTTTDDNNSKVHPIKVIIISSLMGSLTDNTSGGHYGYRTAKAAVNMIGRSLAVDLKPDGIAVGLVHPGYVYTGFGGENAERKPGQRDADESVKGVLEAVDQVTLENSGSFWHGMYGEGVTPISW